MAIAPTWLNPPNFLGAAQSGAQLGVQLRGQDIQAREQAERLRLSFAEQAFRQQMFQQQQAEDQQKMQQQALAAMMQQNRFGEEMMLNREKMALDNQYRKDALDFQNRKNQETLGIRAEGNDIKREAEAGKNARAAGFMNLRQSIADDANAIKQDSNDIRRDSLEWQQEKFWEELDAKERKISEKLDPYDAKILTESLKSIRAKNKDAPDLAAGEAARLLRSFDPRNKAPATPKKKLILNSKGLFQSSEDGQLAPFQ